MTATVTSGQSPWTPVEQAPDRPSPADPEAAPEPVTAPEPTGAPAAAETQADEPVRGDRPFEATILVRILSIIAVSALGFAGYLLVVSPAQQHRSQAVLRAELEQQLAAQTAPTGGIIDPGKPVAILRIPKLRVEQVVVEGTTGGQLKDGPGHRRSSPLPGQAGTAVLMGRALAFGGPFRGVPALRPGDEIRATTGQGEFSYRVSGVRRANDLLPPPVRAGEGRLTLVTVEGEEWFARNRTVFVDATLDSPAQAAQGARTRVELAEETPLARDQGALIGLVLWLQLLVVVSAAMTWSRLRWGRRETWIVGVPALLAVALLVCQSAAIGLLPNLM